MNVFASQWDVSNYESQGRCKNLVTLTRLDHVYWNHKKMACQWMNKQSNIKYILFLGWCVEDEFSHLSIGSKLHHREPSHELKVSLAAKSEAESQRDAKCSCTVGRRHYVNALSVYVLTCSHGSCDCNRVKGVAKCLLWCCLLLTSKSDSLKAALKWTGANTHTKGSFFYFLLFPVPLKQEFILETLISKVKQRSLTNAEKI